VWLFYFRAFLYEYSYYIYGLKNAIIMKNLLLIIFILSVNLGCRKETDSVIEDDVITRWNLIAKYNFTGDGSGDFIALNSNKNIEFLKSGKVRSNGNLCNFDPDTDVPTEATQSIKNSDIILNPINCPGINLHVLFIASDTMDIYYPCIEGCIMRFKKIK